MRAPPNETSRLEEGLEPRLRRFAVAAIALGTIMAVLDGSIANVALPTLARELHVDPAASVWVVNAYQLATTMSLIPLASLGDIYGYRRIYRAGLAVFTLGSLGCALSHSLTALVVFRFLQGFGGAAIMAVGPALYRTIFPSSKLGVALGISALTVASSAAAGPTIGGLILAVLPWPWLFAINVPLGIFDVFLAGRTLPRETGHGKPFDFASALLAAPAFTLLVTAVDGLSRSISRPVFALQLAGSIAFGTLFVARQRRIEHPMLPLDLFASPRFTLAAGTSLCSFVAQGLAFVALPFLFQTGYGYSAFASGLLFTPWPLSIALVAPVAGRLADRYPPAILSTSGLFVFAAGLALLGRLGPHATQPDIIWRAIVCGLGFGFFQSPNNREIMGSAPRERSGSASGVLATVRVTGQALGAALTAVVLGAGGVSAAHLALLLAASAAGAAGLVSALRLPGLRSGVASGGRA
jgi:DHA2 family multidrug resistance protein-like MFS transporter